MSEREKDLAALTEGAIFHAGSESDWSLTCLVLSVSNDVILARCVTSQFLLHFDRKTGLARYGKKPTICRIESVAPLPPAIHAIMLELDKKHSPPYEGKEPGLTRAQIDALMFTKTFYDSHPLAQD